MYTRETILDQLSANKVYSIKDFRAKFPAMYLWYTRHKDEVGSLPLTRAKRANNALTQEIATESALRFQHRSDFQKKDKGAYLFALRGGFLDEICAHMVEKAHTVSEYTKNLRGKPAANRADMTGQVFGKWTVAGPVRENGKLLWECRCDCGTVSRIPGGNLRQGLSTKCKLCSDIVSSANKEIYEYVLSLGFSDAVLSDRRFGFELDIYVPSKNFAIEYDGLYWHSTANHKNQVSESRERARRNRTRNSGVTVFRIFEDEYRDRQEIVKGMIAHRLGASSQAVPEQYEIRFLENPSQYRAFFESNHLDGYGRATFGFGAFIGDRLISAMTFRPYMQGQYVKQMELARFCSDRTINAHGLFGKLLKEAKRYIKTLPGIHTIVSASDNRLSHGKVYKHNGFVEQPGSDDALNYYYYRHSDGTRHHRAVCRKLKPPQITEEQYNAYPTEREQVESGLMAEIKWGKREPLHKVWGWGSKLWILKLRA